ncbi:MAG: acetoin dehydrogenase [Maricaulis sp.]|jgi:short-subunit dehydrogenase|nr:acetoin dehydrogenase [Maricaulis sp.]HAQ34858.1 acetoin dehydrogenase [Alphaproteobacteria bacterium]|tara:strand:- start:56 stop:865 length:810 start_codon:yes stop_codon:yes gene_type:complete
MNWTDHTALITGAGSGIGRALATALHARGATLILTDIDSGRLEHLAGSLKGAATVTYRTLDVSNRAAITALAADPTLPAPTILVNNAGVALGGDFLEISEADFDWLLSINLAGPISMTRAFLPELEAAREAVIVNISSLFGLIAPAGQTAYCASKYALRGFSDSLRHELADTSVRVMTVHPGGVRTDIVNAARLPADRTDPQADRGAMNRFLTMPPDIAAEKIVRGIEKRKRRILIGRDAKIAAFVERIFPDSYWRTLTRLAHRPPPRP